MILDGRGKHGTAYEADICIVGAGAAGLTLATELERLGKTVLLIESGGLDFSMESHALLDVELSEGTPSGLVTGTRERYFGGTTNHWGTTCIPFGPLEFEVQPWMPHSGWPISRKELDPYYTVAAKMLGLRGVEEAYNPAELGFENHPRIISPNEKLVETVRRPSADGSKRLFGRWMRKPVKTNPNITCLLNTTVAELHSNKAGDRVEWVEGRTLTQDVLTFRAKTFVLCAGAIENPRLLLASDSVVPGGLGNSRDVVGRYYMDHVAKPFGILVTTDPGKGPAQEEELVGNRRSVAVVIPEDVRRELGLQAFMALPTKSVFNERLPFEDGAKRLYRTPKPGPPDTDWPPSRSWLTNYEQSPNPNSRILLSSKRDVLGVRKPLMDWRLRPQDIASANQAAEFIAMAIARSGIRRLVKRGFNDLPLSSGGGHQMGSTRMSDDPATGVTDRNCRVHSVENLYIGGSGVFPTGGWQNPTFTIVALALRLAEHLARPDSSGEPT